MSSVPGSSKVYQHQCGFHVGYIWQILPVNIMSLYNVDNIKKRKTYDNMNNKRNYWFGLVIFLFEREMGVG
jgi:hypothetical protein